MRFAILEDEPAQMRHTVSALTQSSLFAEERVDCVEFQRGADLQRALRRETFDLLVLDWNVPDLDGTQLLYWLRRHQGEQLPVVMLSCRSAERDIANVLGMGADDYVVKPFRAVEFAARVRRLLHKVQHGTYAKLERFGGWTFDPESLEVSCEPAGTSTAAARCALSEREFRLARVLFRNAGRAVSRNHLLEDAGYPAESMSSRLLDNHIYRLRSKLGLTRERGAFLQAVYGQGYRLQFSSDSRFLEAEWVSP